MLNNSSRLTVLFRSYANNLITYDEYQELLALLNNDNLSGALSAELKELWAQSANHPVKLPDEEWDEKIQFLFQQLSEEDVPVKPVRKLPNLYKYKWAAAVIFLLMSSAVYYLLKAPKSSSSSPNILLAEKDTTKGLMPGGNRAVLVLADGTSIVLDSSSNGVIASQGGAKVIKLNTGQLVYNSSAKNHSEILYNTLSTPRGGQYQVTLADGTIVWLNSGSSLRYPTAFTGVDRKVSITGEAYLEVAKNAAHPFKVAINLPTGEGGEVEVLGTHFNINAYEDEATVRTTLFEGSVKVNNSKGAVFIKPGQQLRAGKTGQIEIIEDADLEEAIAWKEGRFQFENADIDYVMRQISRWYDIQVEYKGNISHHFTGTISRDVNVLKVLSMLELTGEVNFKIEGKKVFVSP